MKVDAKDIFEAFRMFQTFKEPEKKERKPSEKKEKNFFESFAEMKLQVDQFQQFLKDQEKLAKKDEKKDEKKGLSMNEWMIVLVGIYPIIGLLYAVALMKASGHW